jgi:putative mRNA 3-end processing factor
MTVDLIERRAEGLYCAAGDFYIDPWRRVDRAVITHAHADHARGGHRHYLASTRSEHVLRSRLGQGISLQTLDWGKAIDINGVRVSLHPAGHVLGAAQVRVEKAGEVWVASGDYRTDSDRTCDSFEAVQCNTFITESTFGLPVYQWDPQSVVMTQINAWWQANANAGVASVLYCYSFGKAQRILAGVDTTIGPVVCHSAPTALNVAYRQSGVALPQTHSPEKHGLSDKDLHKALVIAPPAVAESRWLRQFRPFSDAFASGWMRIRGARRRRSLDRGFVLSDHADWPGLQRAIRATGAQRVIVTHGYESVMVRWLTEQGLQAGSFSTEYGTEDGDETSSPKAESMD